MVEMAVSGTGTSIFQAILVLEAVIVVMNI